ncbi:MAG: sulfatase [Planctomycetes bacterium B3_Pla]|nr:MAG: sulfatase [Planctomycetes bacterium B3_Pla]
MKNLNRREFLNLAAGAAATILPLAKCGSGFAGSKNRAERPNIIFIMADDMGYGDLGCYGQKHIKTPNIDRLAEQGTRFTDCYAGSTVCAPSRSVLMTGRHTGHTRVRNNMGKVGGTLVTDNGSPQRRVPLEPQDVTVAEMLKQAGYVTGMTGKWGLGEPGTTGVPNRQGFDEWFGYLNQRRAHTYYPPYLWRNEEKQVLEGNANGGRQQYTHDMFTDFALDFLRRHKTEPFFLYLPYTVPHARYEIPSTEPYTDRSWSADAKVHAAMITRLDGDVGRIMALLKELRIDERTLVFFCSDNGAANRWEGVFDSSGPLRGRKGTMYEGGLRTPMIARWPGKVPAARTCHAPWYFADVLPTFAELTGSAPPANIDGISIMPALLGRRQKTGERFMYWEFPAGKFQQAVRWRNYKAVRLGPGKPLELYDLAEDVAEENDISAEQPGIAAEIEEYLKTARTESPNWPVSALSRMNRL